MYEHGKATTDAAVPEEAISFGTETETQRLGDAHAAAGETAAQEQEEGLLARSIHPGAPVPTPTESLLPKVR